MCYCSGAAGCSASRRRCPARSSLRSSYLRYSRTRLCVDISSSIRLGLASPSRGLASRLALALEAAEILPAYLHWTRCRVRDGSCLLQAPRRLAAAIASSIALFDLVLHQTSETTLPALAALQVGHSNLGFAFRREKSGRRLYTQSCHIRQSVEQNGAASIFLLCSQ